MIEVLPEHTIPRILPFLEGKDLGRCACISKEWAYHVQCEPFASITSRFKARAQVHKRLKNPEDLSLTTQITLVIDQI